MSTYDAILNLEPHHCRYPYGEGDQITFCGAKRELGLSYCATHARKCFTGDKAQLFGNPEQFELPENSRQLEVAHG